VNRFAATTREFSLFRSARTGFGSRPASNQWAKWPTPAVAHQIYLLPRLRMCGVLPPLPPLFMVCIGGILLLPDISLGTYISKCRKLLFFENRAVYEINIVQRDRSQMTIWRMPIACWIAKATNTHTE
jgi:hypothetical protein